MTLAEIIEWAKTQPRNNHFPDEIVESAGFPSYMIEFDYDNQTFTEVDLVTWLCTDTHVGWRLVMMNDLPVAFVYQAGRKCSKTWDWIANDGTDPRLLIRQWAFDQLNNDDNMDDLINIDEEVKLDDIANEPRYLTNVFERIK